MLINAAFSQQPIANRQLRKKSPSFSHVYFFFLFSSINAHLLLLFPLLLYIDNGKRW